MSEDFPFLRAIFHRPDDDAPRLVYADWLEERGDPRAEYLRLEVELRRLPKGADAQVSAVQGRLVQLRPTLNADWVGLISWARDQPTAARLDLILLVDGKGLIEVRGDSETVLLVEGKPVALNWDDCAGSVGQYLVLTGHAGGSTYARQMAEFVADDVDDERPLVDLIEPLIRLFAPGTYCLHYTSSEAMGRITTLATPDFSTSDRELMQYYPIDDRNLVCTQPRGSLNEERVAYFRKQVGAGRRPVVLTTSAEGTWCEFIIDGHHKLEAYNRERMKPAVLNIVRWHASAISLDEGLRYLPAGHPGVAEYRRMKRLAAG